MAVSAHQITFCNLGLYQLARVMMREHVANIVTLCLPGSMIKIHAASREFIAAIMTRPTFNLYHPRFLSCRLRPFISPMTVFLITSAAIFSNAFIILQAVLINPRLLTTLGSAESLSSSWFRYQDATGGAIRLVHTHMISQRYILITKQTWQPRRVTQKPLRLSLSADRRKQVPRAPYQAAPLVALAARRLQVLWQLSVWIPFLQ